MSGLAKTAFEADSAHVRDEGHGVPAQAITCPAQARAACGLVDSSKLARLMAVDCGASSLLELNALRRDLSNLASTLVGISCEPHMRLSGACPRFDLQLSQPSDFSSHRCRVVMQTMLRDEADALVEWIEYHRLLGVEHFYIYDNNRCGASLLKLALPHGQCPVSASERCFMHCL